MSSTNPETPTQPPASEGPQFTTPAPSLPSSAASSSAPPETDIVLDDLSFVRPINRGAHSLVHLVLHRERQRYFALKVLSKERLACAGPTAARAVLREKRALLAVQPHPFITTLHATFQDASRLFLLLELGIGGDLRGVFLRQRRLRGPAHTSVAERLRGALDEPSARFYAASVVLALSHLHSRGYVYRDLKPENILLDDKGFPLLCDLGSAVHLGEAGRAMTLIGTWEYAAPEQLKGRGATFASDWWALGTLLLEALCGEAPFSSGDDDEPLVALAAVDAFHGGGHDLLEGLSQGAVDIVSGALLLRDEGSRWAACKAEEVDASAVPSPSSSASTAPSAAALPSRLRSRAFFASFEWEVLAARQMPPPHEPTLLGAADTRNFWHASFDESPSEVQRVGAGLTAGTPLPHPNDSRVSSSFELSEMGKEAEAASTAAPAPKRARRGAAEEEEWWEGF